VRTRLLALAIEAISSSLHKETDGRHSVPPRAARSRGESALKEARLLALHWRGMIACWRNLNRMCRGAFRAQELFTGRRGFTESPRLRWVDGEPAPAAPARERHLRVEGRYRVLLQGFGGSPIELECERGGALTFSFPMPPPWNVHLAARTRVLGQADRVLGELAVTEREARKVRQPVSWLNSISCVLRTVRRTAHEFRASRQWSGTSPSPLRCDPMQTIGSVSHGDFRAERTEPGRDLPRREVHRVRGHYALLLRCVFRRTSDAARGRTGAVVVP